jgi:hypothetical protein
MGQSGSLNIAENYLHFDTMPPINDSPLFLKLTVETPLSFTLDAT